MSSDGSAIAAFRFPTRFNGTNSFINNFGGGIMLLNTRMGVSDTILFERNQAVFGGGITMDDRCLVSHTHTLIIVLCCLVGDSSKFGHEIHF